MFLHTPLVARWEDEVVPAPLRPVLDEVERGVIAPLKEAEDEDAWAEALGRVMGPWKALRVRFARALLAVHGDDLLRHVDDDLRAVGEIPIAPLPDPAAGAARYAFSMITAFSKGILDVAGSGPAPEPGPLGEVVDDVAMLELALFTLAHGPPPTPEVAEAAAWDAYSRARRLAAAAVAFGLDGATFPRESPKEARERARAMLDRLARGFTEAEARELERVRLPAGDLQA